MPFAVIEAAVDDDAAVRGRVARPRVVFEDGSASRAFAGIFPVPVTDRAIVADGELTREPVILGLTTMMQPVRTILTIEGLALGTTLARTRAPLLGALDEDTIVVTAPSGNPTPPAVTLGRAALSACSSISVNRRARQLTLRCAG